MSTNPGVDGYAVALYRRLSPPYGCVICGENVSCRTVNCWVRLPCGLRHAIPLQNDLQKGNTPDSTFCALADLVRLAGALPGLVYGRGVASVAMVKSITVKDLILACTGEPLAPHYHGRVAARLRPGTNCSARRRPKVLLTLS